jgi:hypothetical protein
MTTREATRTRDVNLNVRVHTEELAKLHALAEDRDLSASTLVRHMLREAYAARFGTVAPGPTKAKSRKAARR